MNAGDRVWATAPVRVCDVGGWTDTWFGSPGQVCSLAVGPGVTVEATRFEVAGGRPGAWVQILPVDLASSSYAISPEVELERPVDPSSPFSLIDKVIATMLVDHRPSGSERVGLTISSSVPPGASLGTSAAVVVAIVGALDALVGGTRAPVEIAVTAHEIETHAAGREAGVQDQWAAALGGAALMTIGPYPDVRHRALALSPETEDALGDRLVTVAFGAHDSSAVHGEVIRLMTACGGAEHDAARLALRRLSSLAGDAAAALEAGDLAAWGQVLVESTEAQRSLAPGLVGPAHQAAIDVASDAGAIGWKVNGAGGTGGSLTVLANDRPGHVGDIRAALAAVDPTWQLVDLRPASGLEVTVD